MLGGPGKIGDGAVMLVAEREDVADGGKGAERRSKFVTMFSRDGDVRCCCCDGGCEVFVETRVSGASSCSCSSSILVASRLFDDDEPCSW